MLLHTRLQKKRRDDRIRQARNPGRDQERSNRDECACHRHILAIPRANQGDGAGVTGLTCVIMNLRMQLRRNRKRERSEKCDAEKERDETVAGILPGRSVKAPAVHETDFAIKPSPTQAGIAVGIQAMVLLHSACHPEPPRRGGDGRGISHALAEGSLYQRLIGNPASDSGA